MNNKLMTFNSVDLGISLSGMLYREKPVFVAVEVAVALGYERPFDAISTHCKSLIKLKHGEMASLGLEPKPNGISLIGEPDVYRLILKSQLPLAERVQDWVCEDVLPSIRETGSYCHQRPKSQAEIIAEMALLNVEQERRLNHVEDKVVEVAQTVENIKRGSLPAGWIGYSNLKAKLGMSPLKCKTLIGAYRVPTDTQDYLTPDGLLAKREIVHYEPFMKALHQMMAEAERRGTRWWHPKMGLFQILKWEAK
ncbi:BRO-N domain-containing protein [Cedecea sp.]|jgi:prophage antirepressor-like protein|uniref:BRO-N domain-containing protein n=1 Tax=Cedecea sp. TaxID=1970739 RepID=UPI002F3EE211